MKIADKSVQCIKILHLKQLSIYGHWFISGFMAAVRQTKLLKFLMPFYGKKQSLRFLIIIAKKIL